MVVTFTVLAVLILGGSAWFYLQGRTYHFLTVAPDALYRDGLRSKREFQNALINSGANTIVSLCDPKESAQFPLSQELDWISRSKIRFYNIPIPLGGYPTTAQVREFLDRTTPDKKDRLPVLVHCAQGIRRTGMMVAAYQMSILGYTREMTKSQIQAFGHSDRTISDIKRFIDIYDPATREVTQSLGLSKEATIGEKEQ